MASTFKIFPLARCATLIGWLLVLAGCPGDGTGLDQHGNPLGPDDTLPVDTIPPAAMLSADVQPILTANCALSGCHAAAGGGPAQGLNLSDGLAYAGLVDVDAVEAPMKRVRPFQPDSSYLLHKLNGTAGTVGGIDTRMPLGRAPLSAAQIGIIRAWIQDGAQNN
ncbi:MAG TPA: hypothetical protein VGA37_16905 [Gemmatimonadales bacterium]